MNNMKYLGNGNEMVVPFLQTVKNIHELFASCNPKGTMYIDSYFLLLVPGVIL